MEVCKVKKINSFIFIVAISMFLIVSCSGGNNDKDEESVSLDPVNIPVAGVSLNRTTLSIPQGGTVQLTATVTNPDSTNKEITWISSDETAAAVSSSGLVTGKNIIGSTTTITVKTVSSDFSVNCIVKVVNKNLPIITTLPIIGNLIYTKSINGRSARGGCILEYEGTTTVTERGLCWNITGSPAIVGDKVYTGISRGEGIDFSLTNLAIYTKYYVRAYATNSNGTTYGDEISFNSGKVFGTNCVGGYVFYNDGNGSGLVSGKNDQIASQEWITGGVTLTSLNGGTSEALNSGQVNTTAIIGQTDHITSAAKICNDYNDGKYGDWYLSSKVI
jgi:Big-like domain-containing protein